MYRKSKSRIGQALSNHKIRLNQVSIKWKCCVTSSSSKAFAVVHSPDALDPTDPRKPKDLFMGRPVHHCCMLLGCRHVVCTCLVHAAWCLPLCVCKCVHPLADMTSSRLGCQLKGDKICKHLDFHMPLNIWALGCRLSARPSGSKVLKTAARWLLR